MTGRSGWSASICACAVALAVAGCGGGEDAAVALDPPTRQCVERFNVDPNAVNLGFHFYTEHGSRRAWVFQTQPGKGVGAPQGKACAVIFEASQADDEFGDVGLTELQFGWASMGELAKGRPDVDLLELQRDASQEANIKVFPDGKLAQ